LSFNAAATLEKWGLLQEARDIRRPRLRSRRPTALIDQAKALNIRAGDTRLRKHEEAYRRLYAAQQAGMQLPQREAVPQLADLGCVRSVRPQHYSPRRKGLPGRIPRKGEGDCEQQRQPGMTACCNWHSSAG